MLRRLVLVAQPSQIVKATLGGSIAPDAHHLKGAIHRRDGLGRCLALVGTGLGGPRWLVERCGLIVGFIHRVSEVVCLGLAGKIIRGSMQYRSKSYGVTVNL